MTLWTANTAWKSWRHSEWALRISASFLMVLGPTNYGCMVRGVLRLTFQGI